MGYHHYHTTDLDTIKREYNTLGIDSFVTRYKKYEALIGDSDVINFIEDKIKLSYELQKRNGRIEACNE